VAGATARFINWGLPTVMTRLTLFSTFALDTKVEQSEGSYRVNTFPEVCRNDLSVVAAEVPEGCHEHNPQR